jgi:hypothetical protein
MTTSMASLATSISVLATSIELIEALRVTMRGDRSTGDVH